MRDMQQSRDTYATINLNSSLYNQTCTKPKNNKIQTEHSSTTSSQDWKQTHHNPPPNFDVEYYLWKQKPLTS